MCLLSQNNSSHCLSGCQAFHIPFISLTASFSVSFLKPLSHSFCYFSFFFLPLSNCPCLLYNKPLFMYLLSHPLFFLSGNIKKIFSLNYNPPLPIISLFPFTYLPLSIQGLYTRLQKPLHPSLFPLWAVTVLMQCCMSMAIDFFFSASLFLFSPLWTLCQHPLCQAHNIHNTTM